MAEASQDLEAWLKKVRAAGSRQEIFKLLDQFRILSWTDEERARMARVYVRILEEIKEPAGDVPRSDRAQEEADGPVWYEKM